ncbi:MAG TPA: ribokinase [Bacilli bacterium]|nr:ribokinase [Bacilli bacterium]
MKRVFVVGSLNMDIVVHTADFPRSGETVLGKDYFTNAGGKGANQAVASAKQGVTTFHMGAVGDDVFGAQLIARLKHYGVNYNLIKTKKEPTGVAIVMLHNGDNRIIVNAGANFAYTYAEAKNDLETYAKPGDILVLQLEIRPEVTFQLIKLAKQLGLYVVFNPAPMIADFPMEILRDVDLLIMNEWETKTVTKTENEKFSIDDVINKLVSTGVKNIIITLGEQGGFYYENGQTLRYNAFTADVVDTTGAGDAFVGAIAADLTRDVSLKAAINNASIVAALTVSRQGAQQAIPTEAEVKEVKKKINNAD